MTSLFRVESQSPERSGGRLEHENFQGSYDITYPQGKIKNREWAHTR